MVIWNRLLFVIQLKDFKPLNQVSLSSFSQLSYNKSIAQTSEREKDEIIESES